MRHLTRLAFCLLPIACGASSAFATDYFVDAVTGSDTNGGLTPNDAFRTITHAIASSTNVLSSRILTGPGTYSAALGETLPLALGKRSLIGVDGSANTLILGTLGVDTIVTGDEFLVEGLTLRNGLRGVVVIAPFSGYSPIGWDVRETVVESMQSHGIFFDGPFYGGFSAEGRLSGVRVNQCDRGLSWYHFANDLDAVVNIVMEDCRMNGNRVGAELYADGFPGLGYITIRRCEFSNNTEYGLRANPYNQGDFIIEDSLFVDNGTYGCVAGTSSTGNNSFSIRRNTVANNGQHYGMLIGSSTSSLAYEVSHNICWGNGNGSVSDFDLSVSAVGFAYDNIIGTSSLIGSNGNVSVDPLFIDAAQGDYRLSANSPAVDAISDPPSGSDVYGVPRLIDGNLDSVIRSDIGAIEHRPLWCAAEVSAGSMLSMQLFSPAPGSARVFGSRQAAFTTPLTTPFGDLYVSRVHHVAFGAVSTGPQLPGVMTVQIPPYPSLIGTRITFQALTTTNSGPTNWRLSNHQEVLIVL